jgi:uncharacterized RDD family membrane protein YckC
MDKTPYVGPFIRVIASIYDSVLLIGVWAAVLYPAVLINGGRINPIIACALVLFSSWVFFATFWMKGGQTLGMTAWKVKLVSNDASHSKVTLNQTILRFVVNVGIVALFGIPLFLIYTDQKKLAVNDIFSKTKLIKVKN